MPHRPLFVLRCHHFSPVIYFIAISVSLAPSPVVAVAAMPFLLLHLRLSLPPSSYGRSFLLSPAPSSSTPLRAVPTNTFARNSPLHNATQFHSPHPPGDFIIRFCLRSVLAPSLSQSSSSCRFVFSFARVAPHRRHFDDGAERKRERKTKENARREGGTRDRARLGD